MDLALQADGRAAAGRQLASWQTGQGLLNPFTAQHARRQVPLVEILDKLPERVPVALHIKRALQKGLAERDDFARQKTLHQRRGSGERQRESRGRGGFGEQLAAIPESYGKVTRLEVTQQLRQELHADGGRRVGGWHNQAS
jgi:hypothetical protein